MSVINAARQRRGLVILSLVIIVGLMTFSPFSVPDQYRISIPSADYFTPSPKKSPAKSSGELPEIPDDDFRNVPLEVELEDESEEDPGWATVPLYTADVPPEIKPSTSSSSLKVTSTASSASSSTSPSPSPTAATPGLAFQPDIDYTDPFNVNRNISYGPWRAEIPPSVLAGESFKFLFHCTNPEPSLCPRYYNVFFHGPSRVGIPPEGFKKLDSAPPLTFGTIQAEYKIMDPGEYLVYAFPDFVYSQEEKTLYCKKWKEEMKFPWNELAVEGTPLRFSVKPNPDKVIEEGWDECPATDINGTDGRYLSTNASIYPRFAALFKNTKRHFIWSPFKCKIPARSVFDAVAQIPSMKNLLVIGDSTSRAYYCTRIWENIHGDPKGTLCDYITHNQTYWDQVYGHKFTWKLFKDENTGRQDRNVSFSYTWAPFWGHNSRKIKPVILELNPPPSHVIYTLGRYVWQKGIVNGRWTAWDTEEKIRTTYWELLEWFQEKFSGSMKHLIIRTPISTVTVFPPFRGNILMHLSPYPCCACFSSC